MQIHYPVPRKLYLYLKAIFIQRLSLSKTRKIALVPSVAFMFPVNQTNDILSFDDGVTLNKCLPNTAHMTTLTTITLRDGQSQNDSKN